MLGPLYLIQCLINSLPYGVMFTTRHCLGLWHDRSAIDTALSRLVRSGAIVRIARGVFAKMKEDTALPSSREIASIKVRGTDRLIVATGEEAFVRATATRPERKQEITQTNYFNFATNGATSSFQTIVGRIFLKHQAPRKLVKGDTPHGLAIRAIWEKGRDAITPKSVMDTVGELSRTEREKVRMSFATIPAWLAKHVLHPLSAKARVVYDERFGQIAYELNGRQPRWKPEILPPLSRPATTKQIDPELIKYAESKNLDADVCDDDRISASSSAFEHESIQRREFLSFEHWEAFQIYGKSITFNDSWFFHDDFVEQLDFHPGLISEGNNSNSDSGEPNFDSDAGETIFNSDSDDPNFDGETEQPNFDCEPPELNLTFDPELGRVLNYSDSDQPAAPDSTDHAD